ncbi:MAG: hypothetical protein K5695_10300 [Oscillospiraceae bacterium]|nr:hypothetical protein [Oscillospiraceae bacterium]
MTILLLTVLLLAEAAFLIAEFSGMAEKREWSKKRLLVDLAELAAFGIMLLLPGIDLNFRFTGLFVLLLLRLIIAGIGCLIGRKSGKQKTKAGKVMSLLVSVMLFVFALTPAFLFKSYKGRPLTGQYTPVTCTAILTDASRAETFEQDGSLREVPVHLFYPAEAEDIADHSLPLVIFSHGAFGWYQSNLSAYQELASNGYVVASIEHPYHSLFTHDTTGKLITADPQFLQDVMTISNGEYTDTEQEEVYRKQCEWIELRIADMDLAVDTLKAAADMQDFSAWTFTEGDAAQFETAARLINTGKIGLMGHSLGGATAVTVGRRADIAAVIDIDGTMIGEQTDFVDGKYVINEEPYTTPLLEIKNESTYFEALEVAKTDYVYANAVVLAHATQAQQTYFAGAEHMNYTDLPLISPFFAKQLGTGEIDPEQCTDTLNKLILDFYNCYLKEQGVFSAQEHY